MIDAHCHPDDEAFAQDLEAILARAAAALEGIVAIDSPAFPPHPGLKIWTTVGIHPHDAVNAEPRWSALAASITDPRLIAIGEIGLDHHYDHSPRATQMEVFERQMAFAAEHGLPVSIHTREAWDDTFAVLANFPRVPGVMHCFTGGQPEADRTLAHGWYLSFSGMLTFKKLDTLRAVAAAAPADRILVETDAPYLAPVPHRGQRNEPSLVRETARQLAACRQTSLDEIDCLTTENFYRLFPRALAESLTS